MDHGDPLGDAHPVLRSVRPPDSPYPGLLRRVANGSARLFVDAAVFPDAAWACDPQGHVLAPLDLARRPDGHDVVVAACAERLDDLVGRRTLTDGEVVTVAVSARRGLAELLATGTDPPAEWWLTDDGRPVLACQAEGRRASEATGALVDSLRQRSAGSLAEALEDLREAVAHPRALARDADLLEAALFGAADPLAIDRGRPARVSGPTVEDDPDRSGRWDELLRGHLDGELSDLTAAAVRSVRDRWRKGRDVERRGGPSTRRAAGRGREGAARVAGTGGDPGRGRGSGGRVLATGADSSRRRGGGRARPWLVAAGLAGVVVIAGMLWPTSSQHADARGGAPATTATTVGASGESGTTTASEELATASAGSTDPPTVDPSDPVAAATSLIAAAGVCGADTSCAAALVEDPAGPTAARLATLAATHPDAPQLVDSYGGAAVVRVAHDGTSTLVVIVAATAGWRVRDVYDVTDTP